MLLLGFYNNGRRSDTTTKKTPPTGRSVYTRPPPPPSSSWCEGLALFSYYLFFFFTTARRSSALAASEDPAIQPMVVALPRERRCSHVSTAAKVSWRWMDGLTCVAAARRFEEEWTRCRVFSVLGLWPVVA
mmetsp:Transcript_26500/g.106109  ORF Transcript_26500/g.106109 Transcript_26500/m.106109 type:complete len:131 (-) Transcript_26500:1638-2030(-)